MTKPPKPPPADAPGPQPLARSLTIAGRLLDPPEATLVDVIDELLNKGVMATGDVTLGVAGIDLIYLRLSSILCAVDRLLPAGAATRGASRHRKPSRGRHRR
jgi:gas vesicle structural protein